MHLEHLDVALAEERAVAQLDVVAAGRGVGHDAVVEAHAYGPVAKVGDQARVQSVDGGARRDVALRSRPQVGFVQVGQQLVHLAGELGDASTLVADHVSGRSVEPTAELGEARRASGHEHLDHLGVFSGRVRQDAPHGVARA